MAKRRSKSAVSRAKRPAQARRTKKKPAIKHNKSAGSATESLREEAERGWAKLDRQIARRVQRDLAHATRRAKARIIQRPNRVGEKTARLAD